jgi:hypothetical protein
MRVGGRQRGCAAPRRAPPPLSSARSVRLVAGFHPLDQLGRRFVILLGHGVGPCRFARPVHPVGIAPAYLEKCRSGCNAVRNPTFCPSTPGDPAWPPTDRRRLDEGRSVPPATGVVPVNWLLEAVCGNEQNRKMLPLQLLCEATRPGFEPGQREPKSLVLPLHYRVLVLLLLGLTSFLPLVIRRRYTGLTYKTPVLRSPRPGRSRGPPSFREPLLIHSQHTPSGQGLRRQGDRRELKYSPSKTDSRRRTEFTLEIHAAEVAEAVCHLCRWQYEELREDESGTRTERSRGSSPFPCSRQHLTSITDSKVTSRFTSQLRHKNLPRCSTGASQR